MISVLVVNYNNSKFLIEAIKSIYTQTLKITEIEVIICNDCSTDDSVEILEELQIKYKFHLLKNYQNQGVGATKKKLIEASRGDWFIFLDSDDKFKPDCLEKLSSYVEILM